MNGSPTKNNNGHILSVAIMRIIMHRGQGGEEHDRTSRTQDRTGCMAKKKRYKQTRLRKHVKGLCMARPLFVSLCVFTRS